MAQQLYELEHLYRIIKKEFKQLNRNRSRLSKPYFKLRTSTLNKYLEAVDSSILIGKSLGNAFTWFFYQFDQNLLVKHMNEERNFHPTYGSGAIAEIEFLKRALISKGRYLLLYHGICDMLRIGDFSVIDLKTLRVNEILELKSQKLDATHFNLSLYCYGKSNSFIGPENIKIGSHVRELFEGKVYKERLQRQIKKIKNLMKDQKLKKDYQTVISSQSYLPELYKKLEKCKIGETKHVKLGDGLIVNYSKICKEFLPLKQVERLKIIEPNRNVMYQMINSTMTQYKELNYPLFGPILYHNNAIIYHPGTMPLIWYQVDTTFLKDLYFGRICLTTIYNPAVFIDELSRIDYQYKIEDRELIIYRPTNGQNLVLKDYMYFVDLVSIYFMKESTVSRLLNESVKHIEGNNVINAKVELQINTLVDI
ncbi:hypothetical protein GGR28_003783 [Lewinella aquimaris]|uniref:Uncharacterized protein n=1 Tax=Neolewinella aquimaris TaxID=1835722 RepID=A0A840EJT0_9BACT|nr:hypothetical protein [Neolewinella aquimaris]MBB4081136.1 hypothetical protein [Neolewinella aquimaris]